jgi:hypothetical protein
MSNYSTDNVFSSYISCIITSCYTTFDRGLTARVYFYATGNASAAPLTYDGSIVGTSDYFGIYGFCLPDNPADIRTALYGRIVMTSDN